MEALQQQYRVALVPRIKALEIALEALVSGTDTKDEAVESIRSIAHALKGSGGTYGFHQITAAANAVGESEPTQIKIAVTKLLDVLGGVVSGEPGSSKA